MPVPTRIVKKYPNVLWTYCIGEPCMPSYKRSQLSPIGSYNIFLNQKYRYLRWFPRVKMHEVEFPYFLQYYGCFHDLLAQPITDVGRNGIVLECHTAKVLSQSQIDCLKQFGPIFTVAGSTEDIIRMLMQAKYFVRMGGRILWGNSMIEAIAAGCIALGNADEYIHKSLCVKESVVRSFDDLLLKIKALESNDLLVYNIREQQRERLDYICYNRPLFDLYHKAKALNIKPL